MGFKPIYVFLAAVVFVAIIGVGWAVIRKHSVPRCEAGATAALGQEFTIGKNCLVEISDTNLDVRITGFYNHPCPKDVSCIWSGLRVDLEYRVNGAVKNYIDLVRDDGYQTRIVKSDYETYATLRVEKSKSYYLE